MAISRPSLASAPAAGPQYIESLDPVTGDVIARYEATPPEGLPAIFEAARAAQVEWAARPIEYRCAMLQRLRDAMFNDREEIADVISRETGKPRVEATLAEVLLALDTADFLAHRAPRWLRPERVPHHNLAMKAKSAWLEYKPHGIVAIISPWNYPFAIPMTEMIAAVVAGNAVVLKPSELTPGTG